MERILSIIDGNRQDKLPLKLNLEELDAPSQATLEMSDLKESEMLYTNVSKGQITQNISF